RRLHRAWPAARPASDGSKSQYILGYRRKHVYRQHHVADPESAIDRPLGSGSENSLQDFIPDDSPVLPDRRLQHEQLDLRRVRDDQLWRARLSDVAIRI